MAICHFIRCERPAEVWALVDGRPKRLCERHHVDATARCTVVPEWNAPVDGPAPSFGVTPAVAPAPTAPADIEAASVLADVPAETPSDAPSVVASPTPTQDAPMARALPPLMLDTTPGKSPLLCRLATCSNPVQARGLCNRDIHRVRVAMMLDTLALPATKSSGAGRRVIQRDAEAETDREIPASPAVGVPEVDRREDGIQGSILVSDGCLLSRNEREALLLAIDGLTDSAAYSSDRDRYARIARCLLGAPVGKTL